ncbi:hypothetical protein PoB_003729700 [Plakobranchus ocellatus]|uniref:Uncharacterized protein n=1 Tax=Plakobranchus ocellatus TaxID=259542 RepID=A0AAV4ATZ7_9GAST|nr:hypothetical protein PoB_003729700 [Plakobranchus ocellatus]
MQGKRIAGKRITQARFRTNGRRRIHLLQFTYNLSETPGTAFEYLITPDLKVFAPSASGGEARTRKAEVTYRQKQTKEKVTIEMDNRYEETKKIPWPATGQRQVSIRPTSGQLQAKCFCPDPSHRSCSVTFLSSSVTVRNHLIPPAVSPFLSSVTVRIYPIPPAVSPSLSPSVTVRIHPIAPAVSPFLSSSVAIRNHPIPPAVSPFLSSSVTVRNHPIAPAVSPFLSSSVTVRNHFIALLCHPSSPPVLLSGTI